MEYSTTKAPMQFPEYGRNVQMLVDYACQITDPVDREKSVKAIINVMGNLNPGLRDNPDFKHILWDHLAIMSDFRLTEYSPYPIPDKENYHTKPAPVERNEKEMKYPTFGRIIENLMDKCKTIDDPDRRNTLIKDITNHMKKSYLLWNKENINDEVIFSVLKEITGGELEVQDQGLKLIDGRKFMQAKSRQNDNERDSRGRDRDRDRRDRNSNGRNSNNSNNNHGRRFYSGNYHK